MKKLGILLITALLVRVLLLLILPTETYSLDLLRWQVVTDALARGENPYVTTVRLSYAPLWIQCLFVVGKSSQLTGWSVHHWIQLLLTAGDLILLSLLWLIGRRFLNDSRLWLWLLVGFAINPTTVLLTVQHGNFDVLFMVFVAGCVYWLLRAHEDAAKPDPTSWLLACLFLGLGILAKTVPIVLLPLLCWDSAKHPLRTKGLGVALTIGPTALGMSVIYALAPAAVAANVLHYRGIAGYFGFSGILLMLEQVTLLRIYIKAFPAILFGGIGVFCWLIYSKRLKLQNPTRVLVFTTLALMFVPIFGSAFGNQYLMWFLPLLPLLLEQTTKPLRLSMVALLIVAAATYLIQFAFADHGGLTAIGMDAAELHDLSKIFGQRNFQTLIRLPLFVSGLICFFLLARKLWRKHDDTTTTKQPAPKTRVRNSPTGNNGNKSASGRSGSRTAPLPKPSQT